MQLHELVAIYHYLLHQSKHVGPIKIQPPLSTHLQLQCEATIRKGLYCLSENLVSTMWKEEDQ